MGSSSVDSDDDYHPDHLDINDARLPKIIRFESMARCGEEVWIETDGQIYRLRKTRQGKLILTK